MLIRLAREDDFAQWVPLWLGYQQFYKTQIADEVTRQTWQRFQQDSEPMFCAVAELDNKLVGLVHYIYHRSCWTAGPYCYLQDLYALPACRGQGVGRALIEHVYATAAQANCARVYWLTHQTNTEAMQLYDRIAEKSGFVQYRKVLG